MKKESKDDRQFFMIYSQWTIKILLEVGQLRKTPMFAKNEKGVKIKFAKRYPKDTINTIEKISKKAYCIEVERRIRILTEGEK